VRINPVVVTVFAAVDNVRKDFMSLRNLFPEVVENYAGHCRMADYAMGLAKELTLLIAGNM
jgi:hypothetical protein